MGCDLALHRLECSSKLYPRAVAASHSIVCCSEMKVGSILRRARGNDAFEISLPEYSVSNSLCGGVLLWSFWGDGSRHKDRL
jgi:hypothetical protein